MWSKEASMLEQGHVLVVGIDVEQGRILVVGFDVRKLLLCICIRRMWRLPATSLETQQFGWALSLEPWSATPSLFFRSSEYWLGVTVSYPVHNILAGIVVLVTPKFLQLYFYVWRACDSIK
jgi:hypothetical protein